MSTTVTSRGQRPVSTTLPNSNQKIKQKSHLRWVSRPLDGRLLIPTDAALSTYLTPQGKEETADTS